ncbi:MAG: flagellar hook-basal body complex protein [Thermoguttaceae bacterium]|jgi:flagellar hook protein FlgE|nr:flagellar hook-basal body complex protein [Thermoguttaceae bacterium]
MGLTSSLTTALTGLTAAETTIDVVGNNLANSNTVGFKASQANFATQFAQTLSLGSAPTDESGGTNPRQTGLGTMVADITADFGQGTIEISSNPTDMAIQGDGFFIVQGNQGDHLYTRNGVFKLNASNEMVTITGNRVLGFGVDDRFQVQTTTLVPLTIPLGTAAVAQSTANVYLEGTLSPNGDVATTAERIQTSILGNGAFTAPDAALNRSLSQAPSILGPPPTTATGQSIGGGAMTPSQAYRYRFVYAATPYSPGPPPVIPELSESAMSDAVNVTLGAGDNSARLTNLPTSTRPLHVYRSNDGGMTYHFIAELPVGTATYDDVTSDAVAATRPALDQTVLTGNYSYYVTFYNPAIPAESRPSPISTPINLVSGRVELTGLPTDATGAWTQRRVYRNLASNDSEFHLVAEIPSATSSVTLIDNVSDAELSTRPEIDLDGPKIIPSTLLKDVLRRDGSTYEHVFALEGVPPTAVLEFTGRKGGRALATKSLTITEATTVSDLIAFMEQAMGIQKPNFDPVNPIPVDSSGASPGGMVTGDGRIIMTGNNGVDNAIEIDLSGMQLVTASGKTNINLPWGSIQEAVGQSAVADFIAYDSLGIPVRCRITAVLQERTSGQTTYRWFADSADNDPATGVQIAVGTGLIRFDGNGNVISVTADTVSIDRRHLASATPLEFKLDFSALSGLAAEKSSLAVSRQDGSAPGVLTSFIVGEDGRIRGVFSNGMTRDLGQIRLVRFANPNGLEQRGQNLFAAGVNSGLPVEGNPGEQGIGEIIAGAVELSNTDIGANLIDLILASTMYRGNTRVITTAQQMLDELLALRR